MEAEERQIETYCVTCKKAIWSGDGRYVIEPPSKMHPLGVCRCNDCGDENFKPKFEW